MNNGLILGSHNLKQKQPIHITRESNKGVMRVRKYSFLLANSSHKSIWELYVLEKSVTFSNAHV